ncbi:hypothetical protein EV175_003874 [Coemansia sp. RSA 1933]|nr:hypothetical protein EV175_003874 [Coemansia sp. RSA 1933]
MVVAVEKTVYRQRRQSLGTVQEYELLAIDYVQGQADMNFAFFFDAPQAGEPDHHPSTQCLHESLVRAMQAFPILTGHIERRKGIGMNGERWMVVVDPKRVNLPAFSHSHADGAAYGRTRDALFRWDRWAEETHMAELHSLATQPLLGLHVVRYACGALSIHTKMRHQVMDGCALFRFFFAWARLCTRMHRGGTGPAVPLPAAGTNAAADYPLCDRLICASKISPPQGPSRPTATLHPCSSTATRVHRYMAKLDVFLRRLARLRNTTHPADDMPPLPAQMHRFTITLDAQRALKERFGSLASCSRGDAVLRKHRASYVTTNDLVVALFWRAVTRAHAQCNPSDPYTCMSVACDLRARIGVPSAYSGNASYPLPIHLTKEAMFRHSVTDTAAFIRYHIDLLSSDLALHMGALLASPKRMRRFAAMFHPCTSFFMASALVSVPMYQRLDFGTVPAHIDIPPYLAPGFSIWLPSNPAKPILAPVPATVINIALRDDVFQLLVRDPEFNAYVSLVY